MIKTDTEIAKAIISENHFNGIDSAAAELTRQLSKERNLANERLRLAFMVSPFPNETCHTYKEWIDSMDAAILKHKSGRTV